MPGLLQCENRLLVTNERPGTAAQTGSTGVAPCGLPSVVRSSFISFELCFFPVEGQGQFRFDACDLLDSFHTWAEHSRFMTKFPHCELDMQISLLIK